jgi:hypothetical protein
MAGISPYLNIYPTEGTGKELDLRVELARTLYGAPDEVPKGRVGLLRKMRSNSNGDLVRCPCRDKITDEPDKDFYCRSCSGMGFLWDERKIVYYRDDSSFRKREDKLEEFEGDNFYLEYNVNVSTSDYIVVVKLLEDGTPQVPVVREKLFKIISADSFRADNGRIEFWRIRATEERNWSIWYGNKNRQHN